MSILGAFGFANADEPFYPDDRRAAGFTPRESSNASEFPRLAGSLALPKTSGIPMNRDRLRPDATLSAGGQNGPVMGR